MELHNKIIEAINNGARKIRMTKYTFEMSKLEGNVGDYCVIIKGGVMVDCAIIKGGVMVDNTYVGEALILFDETMKNGDWDIVE